MNHPAFTVLADPARTARHDGLLEGQRAMRDRIATIIASEATDHDDPKTRDALWALCEHIRKLDAT